MIDPQDFRKADAERPIPMLDRAESEIERMFDALAEDDDAKARTFVDRADRAVRMAAAAVSARIASLESRGDSE